MEVDNGARRKERLQLIIYFGFTDLSQMCLRKWLLGDVEIDNCPPRKERLRCNKKWLHGWKICQYPVWCWGRVHFYTAFFYSACLEQNVCFLIINALIDKAIRHKMENLFPCFEGFGTLKFLLDFSTIWAPCYEWVRMRFAKWLKLFCYGSDSPRAAYGVTRVDMSLLFLEDTFTWSHVQVGNRLLDENMELVFSRYGEWRN